MYHNCANSPRDCRCSETRARSRLRTGDLSAAAFPGHGGWWACREPPVVTSSAGPPTRPRTGQAPANWPGPRTWFLRAKGSAVESAVRPRVIVGVGGRGFHPRVVDTAVSLARGTGAVLYAVDVRDDHTGDEYRAGPPAMQDAYHALSRASVPSDGLDVRIVVTP